MTHEKDPGTDLVKTPDAGLPTPVFTGRQMADALTRYKELQRALDASMPDQLMKIQGRVFRKKGYWRALSVAFKLKVAPVLEERLVSGLFEDGRENFGYNVTYEATAADGRTAVGDGACFAVEKAAKFRCPHPQRGNPSRTEHWPGENCPDYDPSFIWKVLPAQASEHNVRSHAHSRAFNRAVSNLVGFGEVSAEELRDGAPPMDDGVVDGEVMDHGEPPHPADEPRQQRQSAPQQQQPQRQQPRQQPPAQQQRRAPGPTISEAQDRRLFARAMAAGWDAPTLNQALAEVWNYKRTDEVTKADYEKVVKWVDAGPGAAAGEA